MLDVVIGDIGKGIHVVLPPLETLHRPNQIAILDSLDGGINGWCV